MTKRIRKVLLFEDDKGFGPRIEAAIRKKLPSGYRLIRFVPKKPGDEAYEDRLYKELTRPEYANPILIVSDRDLSKTETYTGLSEAIVSKVAGKLGVPVCVYARGYKDELLERQRSWGDGKIVVDFEPLEAGASKVSILASGFSEITLRLKNVLRRKGRSQLQTPAAVIATILGKLELTDQIALYGSGDQKMVSEILPFVGGNKRKHDLETRLPCLLGYWLYDSILRFPGLLVNAVAAASHLNISVGTFKTDSEVQNLFKSAIYDGPFQDQNDPLWWRGQLDDLLMKAACVDGRSFVKKRLGRMVKRCHCSVNPRKKAGWYCMVTRQPVSLENSRGNISWFPPGADLARIRNDIYNDVGPWLGLV